VTFIYVRYIGLVLVMCRSNVEGILSNI